MPLGKPRAASSARPAPQKSEAKGIVSDGGERLLTHGLAALSDGRFPVAGVCPSAGDEVAYHPVARLQSPGLVKLNLRFLNIARLEEHRAELDVSMGIVGPNRDQAAKRVGRFHDLTALAEGLAQAGQGEFAPRANTDRDAEEADRFLGLAGVHQLAAKVGVDPEVVGVRPLGATKQCDGRLAPA